MDAPADSNRSQLTSSSKENGEPSLESIRRILLAREVERINQLEEERTRLEADIAGLQARLIALQAELAAAEGRLHDETNTLAAEIDDAIARRVQTAPEEMAEALGPVMAGALRVQERRAHEELVDAISPVISESIELQIRNSRQSLVEALFPIIGEMAQRYIGEFFRELQRNIDARLKSTLGPERFARRLRARLRGVPVADLEMRDALPFSVRELFLIQSGTGILLARAGTGEAADSDLISGMLTAVREFMHDSFGHEESIDPMDEIQYGEQRIIIQDGRLCYLAVVIRGVEPPGFRAELRRFLTRLQSTEYQSLQTFDGDMTRLGAILPAVDQLAVDLNRMVTPRDAPKPLPRSQKLFLALGGLAGLLFLGLACFYLQFTLALLPLAFGDPTPTNTLTPSPTQTATITSTPTATATTPPTTTATPAATATSSPTPTPTTTPTTRPSPTNIPFSVVTNRPVWAFSEPDLAAQQVGTLDAGTPVTIIAYQSPWLLVEWDDDNGPQQGWLSERWVDFSGTPPPDLFATPEG